MGKKRTAEKTEGEEISKPFGSECKRLKTDCMKACQASDSLHHPSTQASEPAGKSAEV